VGWPTIRPVRGWLPIGHRVGGLSKVLKYLNNISDSIDILCGGLGGFIWNRKALPRPLLCKGVEHGVSKGVLRQLQATRQVGGHPEMAVKPFYGSPPTGHRVVGQGGP
jgi:hypothetical protein